MDDEQALSEILEEVDGRGYGAWRELAGTWSIAGLTVEVERVQPDPYAPPTRLAVEVPPDRLGLPAEVVATHVRRRALVDHLLRVLAGRLSERFVVDVGGQQVLERTAGRLDEDGGLFLRLGIELPDRSRTVRGEPVAAGLLQELPAAVRAIAWEALDREAAHEFVATVEDAAALRAQLAERELVAFVADGARLARRSGIDDRPADRASVVPFTSPESLRVTMELPNRGRVRGMGLPEGVTVIVGGGFHGKSTLLNALRAGVYDHVPGDGRELVVTRADAVTIRAEDGRRVERVDISPFVDAIPVGAGLAGDPDQRPGSPASTQDFSSDDASGSTSQAAAIVEALEVGTGLLLIDEDTAATNLMIRDRRMQALISTDEGLEDEGYAKEPITPFVDLVRSLAHEHGVSTVLVVGAVGDYLEVADQVVQMEAFQPRDVTQRAHWFATVLPGREPEETSMPPVAGRVVDPSSVDSRRNGRIRTRVRGLDRLEFGEEAIELTALDQLVEPSQVAGVASALVRLSEDGYLDGSATVREALTALFADVDASGMDVLRGNYPGDLARPRPAEVAAALNRLRSLRIASVHRPEHEPEEPAMCHGPLCDASSAAARPVPLGFEVERGAADAG